MAPAKKYYPLAEAQEYKARREARETIRRCDPALAMYLDIRFPLEECPHWGVQVRSLSTGASMYTQTYKCAGCDEELDHPRNGYYRTKKDSQKVYDALKQMTLEEARASDYDG